MPIFLLRHFRDRDTSQMMGHPDELREQIDRQRAEYRARLSDGMEPAHAVICLREIRRLEAALAKIEGDGDKCEQQCPMMAQSSGNQA